MTVFGKGGHTRHVLLSQCTWEVLCGIRHDAGEDHPLFTSRTGGGLSVRQVQYIVRQAARRADVDKNVSPTGCVTRTPRTPSTGAPRCIWCRRSLGHSSVATTGRYLHARPTESSSKYLAV